MDPSWESMVESLDCASPEVYPAPPIDVRRPSSRLSHPTELYATGDYPPRGYPVERHPTGCDFLGRGDDQ